MSNTINKKIPVSKESVLSYMTSAVDVCVLDCVDSTNRFAKDVARSEGVSDFLVVAREQSAGRGRYTRKFFSPKDSGVYFSLVIKPTCDEETKLITPLVAVAVANAIFEVCKRAAKIKWVNDIIVDNKKCCGILCEGILENQKIDKIVLGIGINLYDEGIDGEIKDIASAVGDGVDDCANRLVAKVVDNIYMLHNNFDRAHIVEQYRQLSYLTNKFVAVLSQNDEKQAFVLGIDDECKLIVRYQDNTQENLSTGEVKIKW